jgi:hypothetical protein
MPTFVDSITDWSGGVVTAGRASDLAASTSPRGRNAYLKGSAPETATPTKRRGFTTVNASNGSSMAASITAQYQFIRVSGGTTTRYHLIYSSADSGGVRVVVSDPGGAGTTGSVIFTPGTTAIPDFASAVNHCFVVAGGSTHNKWDGTTATTYGIVAPSTGASVAAGAAGTPSGTYEVRYTFYNGTTGHESSASATSGTVTLASQILAVTSVDTSADAQVTARRIYVRNTATMTNFYLAGTISDNTATTFNWNAADSTLVTLGPDTEENNPPPTGAKVIAWHRSRMFVSDGTTLFYSKLGKPEAFDPDYFEYVNPQDGQEIKGLYSYGDTLLIFKDRATYGLFGIDPATWQIRLLWDGIGLVHHKTLRGWENTLWWWSTQGAMQMTNLGTPLNIGKSLLAPSIAGEVLSTSEYSSFATAVMPEEELVLFAALKPSADSSFRHVIFPWNYRLNRWVSDEWTGIAATSLLTALDSDGVAWVYVGGPYASSLGGQVFRLWDTDTDGVVSGTVTGTFVAGGASQSTVTSSGFVTTGQALAQRAVTIVDSNGALHAQRFILSNTSTVLTLNASFSTTSGATYTFHVGGPAFEWDTKEMDSGVAFHRKRYEFLHTQTGDTAATVGVQIFVDNLDAPSRYDSFSTSSSTQHTVHHRTRVAATGVSWRARITNYAAAAPFALYGVGMTGQTQQAHTNG